MRSFNVIPCYEETGSWMKAIFSKKLINIIIVGF